MLQIGRPFPTDEVVRLTSVAALTDSVPRVRAAACGALASAAARPSFWGPQRILKGQESSIPADTAGNEVAVSALCRILSSNKNGGDEDTSVRIAAARALGEVAATGDPKALSAATAAAAREDSTWVREAALAAVGKLTLRYGARLSYKGTLNSFKRGWCISVNYTMNEDFVPTESAVFSLE